MAKAKAKRTAAEIEGANDLRVLAAVQDAIGKKRGRPARGEGSSVLGLRLADSVKAQLESAARRFNVDVSTFVRRASLFIALEVTVEDEPGLRVRITEAIMNGETEKSLRGAA